MKELSISPSTDYKEILQRLEELYGKEWLMELGRLIVEGDKEQKDL